MKSKRASNGHLEKWPLRLACASLMRDGMIRGRDDGSVGVL
jgi:hypothetical protein